MNADNSENSLFSSGSIGDTAACDQDNTPRSLRWAARSVIMLLAAVLAMGTTLLLLLPVGGCGNPQLSGLAWFLQPILPKKKVKAEYGEMQNSTVAILIYPREAIEVEYPSVKLTLSSSLAATLRKNVNKIKIVDPRVVMKFQDENLDWLTAPRKDICRKLGVDFIILISLQNYTTREEGSRDSFRGRIAAEASVYKASNSNDTPVWQSQDMRAAYPAENEPVMLLADGDDSKIREKVEQLFSDQLGKKFYTYKEEPEE